MIETPLSIVLKDLRDNLREIRGDFKHFDDKWELHIKKSATDSEKLVHLCKQVDNIERLLTRGNGQFWYSWLVYTQTSRRYEMITSF